MADSSQDPPQDAPQYRVIVGGRVLPEHSRDVVIDKLVALFHSQRGTMEKLLQGKPTSLTKQYTREEAEKIYRAIREAGAECTMEEIVTLEVAPDSVPDMTSDVVSDVAPTAEPMSEEPIQEPAQEPAQESAQQSSWKSAMMRFVSVNTEYYTRQFAKFGDIERPSFALSWHWPAFLAFFFWAMYRKLWLLAGVNLVGGLVLLILLDPGFIFLAWAIFWPLAANYLYFRHVRNCVLDDSAVQDGDTKDDYTKGEGPDPRGGVSRGAVGLGMVMMFLLSAALNDLIQTRMIERYSERISDILPEPGTRQRGDGSAIDEVTSLDPQSTKTVTVLGILAASLKLAASNKGLDDNQLAFSVLEKVITQKKIKDAWGNSITVRQDATGQIMLVSAGPDSRLNNDDDILQYIHFDRL